jgi:hypothetical protein
LLKPGNLKLDGPPAAPAHDMMVVMPITTQAVVNLAILPDGIQLAILRHDLQIAIHRGDADPAAFLKQPVIYGLRGGEGIVLLQLLYNLHPRPGDSLHRRHSALPVKPEGISFPYCHAFNYM